MIKRLQFWWHAAAAMLLVLPALLAVNAADPPFPPTLAELVLPDPLMMNDGSTVTSTEHWRDQRRPELLELFSREMYGRAPERPKAMTFEVFDDTPDALDGRATRRQVALYFNGQMNGPRMDLLIYTPNAVKGPAPAILGMNFWGNHAVHPDPGIRITTSFMESNRNPWADLSCVTNNRATEGCRGINARHWPVERFIERGYAFATIYRGDLDPDFDDGFTNGVHALYPELQRRGDNFSTIGAWAWGLSRAMDYLESDSQIDGNKVAVFGWSRLGKTALWAGASDERFAMVLSNESGAGGAKLFRRGVGEDIRRLHRYFPHWYCGNFWNYVGQDTELPFDQHLLISLIAPRPVYIGSALEDTLADPLGEFLGARAADRVYRFLGTDGLPADEQPPVNTSVQGRIGYHVREGVHEVREFDWTQYLAFMDRHFVNQ